MNSDLDSAFERLEALTMFTPHSSTRSVSAPVAPLHGLVSSNTSVLGNPHGVLYHITQLREEYNMKFDALEKTIAEIQSQADRDASEQKVESCDDVAIEALTHERDHWKNRSEDYEKSIQVQEARIFALGKRQKEKLEAQQNLSKAYTSKIEELEGENRKLKSRISDLGEERFKLEKENWSLRYLDEKRVNEMNEERRKKEELREALDLLTENTMGACESLEKKLQEARDALKKEKAESKKNVLLERNRADRLKCYWEFQKQSASDLRALLKTERSGKIHMRKHATDTELAQLVIPVVFSINSKDYFDVRSSGSCQAWQIEQAQDFQFWYDTHYKAEDEDEEYAGEEYAGEEYAGEEYAGEEYAGEEYAGEEYAGEEYTGEEYAGEEYADEEHADEEHADEEYADEEYADEEYASE